MHSDKLELMRDVATYEANVCESISFRSNFSDAYDKVSKCLKEVTGHTNEMEKFSETL